MLLAVVLSGAGCAPGGVQVPPLRRPLEGLRTWAVYYDAGAAAATALARFDLVVLDPDRHPPLDTVTRHRTLVLMYVSVGEINVHHPDYASIAREPWVLDANPDWPEARRLDVRAPAYTEWLQSRLVARALAPSHVHGVFLDTADAALELERVDPKRFGGARTALERTVRAIRTAHPGALVVLNSGLDLAERLVDVLDGVVMESVWTDYDFGAKRYLRRDAAEAEKRATLLSSVAARGLVALTLEYAPPDDPRWVAQLIGAARTRGFVPYVSTIGLDRVFTHTLR